MNLRAIASGLRSAIDQVATVVTIAAGCAIVWAIGTHEPESNATKSAGAERARRAQLAVPTEPVSIAGAPRLGLATAPVVVIEYSDFRCPFCARFVDETLPTVNAKLIQTGKMQLIFKHLPLQGLHPDAPLAAKVAECARQQDLFWPAHDALFKSPRAAGEAGLVRVAKSLRLDRLKLESCLASSADGRVEADVDEARRFGLSGTPAFLFGRLQKDGLVEAVRWQPGLIRFEAFDSLTRQLAQNTAAN